jgi:excinuclease UvrABC nuclease subunit
MKDLVYRPPCDLRAKFLPWLHELRNQSGAYVIRDRQTHRAFYVGESHTGRLAKTVKRHFWPWKDDPERRHRIYSRHAVEIAVRLTPPDSAVGAQVNLIQRLDPRDNRTGFGEEPF